MKFENGETQVYENKNFNFRKDVTPIVSWDIFSFSIFMENAVFYLPRARQTDVCRAGRRSENPGRGTNSYLEGIIYPLGLNRVNLSAKLCVGGGSLLPLGSDGSCMYVCMYNGGED